MTKRHVLIIVILIIGCVAWALMMFDINKNQKTEYDENSTSHYSIPVHKVMIPSGATFSEFISSEKTKLSKDTVVSILRTINGNCFDILSGEEVKPRDFNRPVLENQHYICGEGLIITETVSISFNEKGKKQYEMNLKSVDFKEDRIVYLPDFNEDKIIFGIDVSDSEYKFSEETTRQKLKN